VDKGLEYPLNAMEGWLAAEKLRQMKITDGERPGAVRLIKQVNRCAVERGAAAVAAQHHGGRVQQQLV
jgi:hypothetical protein